MKICSGCGANLQAFDPKAKGFSPNLANDLCQRCFRIKHYDDLIKSYQNEFDNFEILSEVNKTDRLVIWVVDLFDFESNIIEGLNRHLYAKDIILVGSKRDLLPDTLGNQKLLSFIYKRLKFYGINVSEVIFTGDYGYDGSDAVLEAIEYYRNNRDVIIIGQANVGKSTLINALANTDITISRYPGTTLDLIEIDMGDYNLYDTPGLIKDNNIQYYLDSNDLNIVVPNKVKPINYQINKDNCFLIGGLVKIDVEVNDKASIVFFKNDMLTIHRTNKAKANQLWEDLAENEFKPKINGNLKTTTFNKLKQNFDVVISGLGFIKFRGNIKSVNVTTNENVEVIVREALV